MTAFVCDTLYMSEEFDIAVLRRNLAAIMARKDRKPTTLSLEVGKSPSLVKDLLEKTGDTKLSTVFKLANALGVSVDDLLTSDLKPMPSGPELYLKGEVAAGQWVDAYEWPREEWQSYPGRPDITASIDHRFFLRVAGDSMDEVYPEGTVIECVGVFAEPEIKPGKRVVVVRERRDGRIEATVKELIEVDGRAWARPRSTNPSHQSFALDEAGNDITEVRIVAVVVSSIRPE